MIELKVCIDKYQFYFNSNVFERWFSPFGWVCRKPTGAKQGQEEPKL
jgi:hypothetical protein